MKDEIIEISLQQFLKYGIRKMTVQNLVAPLGISTKTVYKYFKDKEDLLKQCLNLHYKRLSEELANLKNEQSNPVILLFKIWHMAFRTDFGVNHIFYHDLNYYFPQLQDAIVEKYLKKNNNWLEELLIEAGRQGYLRNDIVPAVAIESIRVLYAAITRTPHYKKFKLLPAQLMQNTLEVFLRGMCTDKGLATIQQQYSFITQ